MVRIVRTISATTTTPKLYTSIGRSYDCMLSPPASEIRLAALANPLAFTCPFYQTGSRTHNKCFCSEKTKSITSKREPEECSRYSKQNATDKPDGDLGAHRCFIRNSRSASVCNCSTCGKTHSDKRVRSYSVCRQRSRGSRLRCVCHDHPTGYHIYQFLRRIPPIKPSLGSQ
jgi:hypothetical protein